jgi:hypothetical protein
MFNDHQARDDRHARQAGFRDYQEYLDAQYQEEYRGYQFWQRIAAEKLSAETGIDYHEALDEVRQLNSEFHQEFSKVAKNGFQEGDPYSEGKEMAEFLEYLGLRDEEDWWGVGDTPELE